MSFLLTGPTTSLILFGLGAPNLPINPQFVARQSIVDITVIMGASVEIDARHSITDTGNLPTYFYWRFAATPIGSQVARVGFEDLEEDSSRVEFIPDITGFYRVELIVGDDAWISAPVYSDVYVKILDVPTGQGLVPDVSFLWDYLGDFWNLFTDKGAFSTLWSSYTQILTNRLLSLYQIDFNKSINTIQDLFQRKWLNFNPELTLEDSYLLLGDDYCGTSAYSNVIGLPKTENLLNQITILGTEGNLLTTPYGSKVGKRILSFWESSHNLYKSDYVTSGIIPTSYSLFFTKENEVINSTVTHPWRLCYTLGSSVDFEMQGVKSGDRLKIAVQTSINDKPTGQTSFLYLPVIAVRGNQLGFSFSESLQDGIPDVGFSDQVIQQLASDLQIEGVTTDLAGNVLYRPNSPAKYIHDVLLSTAFKRMYYEKQLELQEFDLGYFQSKKISISVKPVSVFRYKAIHLPGEALSVPTLQEFIEQPGFSEMPDGKKYIIKIAAQNEVTQSYRNPLFLFENLDFITSSEELDITCNFIANNKTILSTFGDFIDRSVQQGDSLQVSGINRGEYVITGVRSNQLDLYPVPAFNTTNSKCKLIRRIKGNFLRFVDGCFSADGPLNLTQPPNLWSEVTFFDNGKTVEDNFGVLVSITREQLKKQQISSSYKAAVAGLLYGLCKGPSMENLRIGAQILLGLPFTYYKGTVLEIKPTYELGEKFEPKIGRITIEETDNMGKPTGLVINYFYPQGTQILVSGQWVPLNPDFSGLATNPLTGQEYKIGDSVAQFAPLSKGIEIADYLSDPIYINSIATSFEDQLRKYHTIYLRANTDLFNGPNFTFVINYIKLIKPAFLFLKSALEKDFQDDETITDKLLFDLGLDMFDINGLSLPAANKFDYYNDSPQIFTMDGRIFTRYIKGYDLSTSLTAVSQAGGFVTARTREFHDSPYILPGDRLIIYGGINNGSYEITSVVDDKTLITTGTFEVLAQQTFSIYREVKNPIWTGTCNCTNGNNTIAVPAGNLSAGVAVGDMIFFYGAIRTKTYRINAVNGNILGIDGIFIEPTGSYSFVVYREDLLTTFLLSDATTFPFIMNFTNGNPWAFCTTSIAKYIPKKGDTLVENDGPVFDILDFDETTKSVYLNPTPTMSYVQNCQLQRTYVPTGFSVDINTICEQDGVSLEIFPTTSTAVCISGNAVVTFSMGTNLSRWNILPGDFFKLYTGVDAGVDIGYGSGAFVIAEVTATQVTLTRPLIQTQNMATYSFLRIREIS